MTRFDLQALVDARTQPVAGRHGGQWESQFRALPSNRPQGFLDFEATTVFQGVEGRDLMGRACVSTLSQGERRLRADPGFEVAKKLPGGLSRFTLVEQDETLLAAYAARVQAAVKPMSRSGGSKTRVR